MNFNFVVAAVTLTGLFGLSLCLFWHPSAGWRSRGICLPSEPPQEVSSSWCTTPGCSKINPGQDPNSQHFQCLYRPPMACTCMCVVVVWPCCPTMSSNEVMSVESGTPVQMSSPGIMWMQGSWGWRSIDHVDHVHVVGPPWTAIWNTAYLYHAPLCLPLSTRFVQPLVVQSLDPIA